MLATVVPTMDKESTQIPETYTLPLSLVPELNREMEQLWKCSVKDANNCANINDLTDRYRQAYLGYSVRLIALLQGKHADYKMAALSEDKSVINFRDALLDKVDVSIAYHDEVHRGPYVPGGSYKESIGEYVLASTTAIVDLDDVDHDHIPVEIEAVDNSYGAELLFRLDQVNRDVETPFAEFSVEVLD